MSSKSVAEFHTIVLGLGAMGSAVAYQLSKRTHKVLGIDRFCPPHSFGSTHGDTRLIRQAIGEGPDYTLLSLRSYDLWREIENESGSSLLNLTGGLIISSSTRSASNHVPNFFTNTLAAAKKYCISHETLSATEIRKLFPPFNVKDDEIGYFEKNAGFLRPEKCVSAQLELAQRHGALLQQGETVQTFGQKGEKVFIRTDRSQYYAENLIVTAGPWLPTLLEPEFARHFTVTRQVNFWFQPRRSVTPFAPKNFPVFIWEPQDIGECIYGFPATDGIHGGVKISSAKYGMVTSVETVDRKVAKEEMRAMYRKLVFPCFPTLSSRCVKATSCLYTVTTDAGFVIARHPYWNKVLIVSPCSGHGFKHSAAIGEVLAQITIDGRSWLDLSKFKLDRFGTQIGSHHDTR